MKNKLTHNEKIEEYIEKMNNGYIPKNIDLNNKFSDGDLIYLFWIYNKKNIDYELNNNLKYKMDYLEAKKILLKKKIENVISYEDKIEEYIEKLNNGYIPKKYDLDEKFSNGIAVKYFWNSYNKRRMFFKLEYNPNYQEGYLKAKLNFQNIDINPKIKCKIKTKKRNV